METIVVGSEGSEGARAALDFAVREAALREGRLRIVSVWEIPPVAHSGNFVAALDQHTLDDLRSGAESTVQQAVAAAEELEPWVECEGKAVEGQSADVLLHEAHDAA